MTTTAEAAGEPKVQYATTPLLIISHRYAWKSSLLRKEPHSLEADF